MNDVATGAPEVAAVSAAAKTITYVCVNKENGKLFYLASCKASQTKVLVTSTSPQFKACYLESSRVTRKVSNSTTCRDNENTIPKVPANSSSLYFCVDSEGKMYFKGTSEPTCGGGRYAVEIKPHNRPPTARNDGPYSVQEDGGPLSISAPGVLANDTDPDGDTIRAQLVTGPAHKASFTLNANGSFSYSPAANYNGPDSFTYKAKDSNNVLSSAATVRITVTPVNDTPTNIALSRVSVEENKPAGTTVGTLSTTDQDTADTHTYTLVSGTGDTDNAKFQISGSSLQTREAFDFETKNSYSILLKADDGNGGTFQKQFTILVSDINDAPVASDDSATLDEGDTVGGNVLTNDDDADGDTLDAILVSGPANASSFNLNPDGSFSYTHDGSETTSDSFTYKANDGTADSNTATVSITVNSVNDAPVAEDQSVTTDEDTDKNITLGASDVENDTLSYTVVDGPEHGTLSGSGANLTYTPGENYNGSDSFTFKANDGTADSNVAKVTITINALDDPPKAAEDSETVSEDSGATSIDVLANDDDIDGGPMIIESVTQPDNGAVTITGGGSGLTYEPDENYCNGGSPTDDFTYTLNGGSSAKVSVTVECVNDAPVADDQSVTTDEDTAKDVTLGGSDVENDTLTYDVVDGPEHGTLSGSGASYTPETNYNGSDSFTFKANDGTADSGPATVTITVNPINDAPSFDLGSAQTVVNNAGAQTVEGFATNISKGPQDEEAGQTLTFDVTNDNNALFSAQPDIDETSGDLTYAPNENASGTATVTVVLKDDGGTASGGQDTSTTKTFTITVNLPNSPPTAASQSVSADEDTAKTITLEADDPDGDAVTSFTISEEPAHGSLSPVGQIICNDQTPKHCTAEVSYTPEADYNGPDQFKFTASDGQATSEPATVDITVNAVDDLPVAEDDSATVGEDSGATAIDVLANDTDIDDGPKTIDSVTRPANGIVVITNSGAGLTYEPNANYCNDQGTDPDTFTYTLSPGGSTATVSVKVTCVDDPPVAVNDSATVLEDAAATNIPVLTNDTDIDDGPKTISSASDPANGTVVVTDGGSGLTYKPDANYCNDPPATNLDTFTYTLNGGSQGTVSMKVTCVNDAPTAANETFNGAIHNTSFVVDDPSDAAPNVGGAKKTITGDVLSNDSDVETPGSISVVASTNITSTNGGKVTIEADGDFTYVSDPADNCSPNSDSFNYTLTDNDPAGAQTAQGTVTINLSGCVWYVDNDPAESGNAGTSADPFDALSSAQAKSVANQSVFVHKGTSNYTGGFNLDANERLIGEAVSLVVGGDTLFTGTPTNRPSLSGSVNLNAGNTISGVAIAGSGAPAISGGSGDNSGTIADVTLSGGSGGLDLNTTSGTWNLSDLTVSTTGGDAIRAATAGTVNFTSAGTISVTAAAGRGLNLSGTATSGVIDSTTVTSSANEGIRVDDDTGSLTLDDVNLTTTGTGLDIDSSNDVTVNSSGDADITSTGRAVSLTTVTSNPANMPDVTLDQVSSTGGTTGINIDDIGNGTFSANGGTLSGHTGAEVDVNNGSGNTTYPGTIGNGSGLSVQITGRTGGTVALAGNINDTSDAGGGIDMTSNSGGTVTFSGATKTLNTGASPAFSSTGSNPTITFSGGGLDIDTTSGAGFSATGGGTVTVQGSGNTIDAVSAPALIVANTTIGSSNVTFQRISSGNATAAADPANGLVLNNTGTAAGNGGLVVTGTGGTCTAATPTCTGGTIQTLVGGNDSSFTPVGTGIVLTSTRGPSLTSMRVRNASNYGIRGNQVTNLSLANSLVDGTNGSTEASPFSDGSISFDTILGTNSITGSEISGGWQRNIRVDHATGVGGGTMTLNITGNNIHDTVGTAPDDGVFVEAENNDNYTVNVANNTLKNHGGDHVNVTMINNATINVSVTGNTLENPETPVRLGGGIFVFGASWNGTGTYTVSNNTILRNRQGGAIHMNKGSGTGTLSGSVTNNTIGTSGVNKSGSIEASGIVIGARGASGTHTTLVEDNNIFGWNDRAIILENGEGSPTLNATVRGNTADTFDPVNGLHGLHADLGILSGDAGSVCLDVGGALTADRNHLTLAGNEAQGGADIRVRRASAVNLRMPGYAGGSDDDAAVTSYLSGRNDVTGLLVSSPGTGTYSGGGACPQP